MSLHDLLDETARTAPPADAVRSADAAWRTASRRRQRTRITAVSAVLGLVVAAVLAGTWVDRPTGQTLPGQGETDQGQGIPARIYSVKSWLPSIGSAPIPPIAYVVEQSYLERPVAISVDGSYRYLPTAPDGATSRLSSYAVSSDGRHLALAWSDPNDSSSGAKARAQIWAYDVTSGVRAGPWVGQGFGSEITDLVWRPDNRGFAFEEHPVEADGDRGATEPVAVVAMFWDHYSQRIVDAHGPVAWSPDGTELLVSRMGGPRPKVVELPSGASRFIDVPVGTDFGPAAWAPDGERIAGIHDRTNEVDLVLADPAPGAPTLAVLPLGEALGQSVLGWRGGNLVLANYGQPDLSVQVVDPLTARVVGPPLTTGVGKRADERLTAAVGLLATQPVVSTGPPEQSRLSWAYVRAQPVAVAIAALLLLGLVLGATATAVTRRRRRRPALDR